MSKTIYSSEKTLPYVYKCVHKTTGQFYIGYRAANKIPSSNDLGFVYFTSSKTIKTIGFENFDYTILAEFFNWGDAYEYEQNLIAQYINNPQCLNKNVHLNSSSKWSRTGVSLSEYTKNKLRIVNLGKSHSGDTKQKISNSLKGKIVSNETKNKMKKSWENRVVKPLSQTHKINIGKSHRGRKHTLQAKYNMKLAAQKKNSSYLD
jgi:hypothetical protein